MNLRQVVDTGLLRYLDQLLPQLDPNLAALAVGKHEIALESGLVLFAEVGQQILEGAINRNLPLTCLRLPELLTSDLDLPACQVDIIPLKILKFSFPHPRMQKRKVDRI